MSEEQKINPKLLEVLNNNLGNRITPELGQGLVSTLQGILNEVCLQAFNAGEEQGKRLAYQEQAAMTEMARQPMPAPEGQPAPVAAPPGPAQDVTDVSAK